MHSYLPEDQPHKSHHYINAPYRIVNATSARPTYALYTCDPGNAVLSRANEALSIAPKSGSFAIQTSSSPKMRWSDALVRSHTRRDHRQPVGRLAFPGNTLRGRSAIRGARKKDGGWQRSKALISSGAVKNGSACMYSQHYEI